MDSILPVYIINGAGCIESYDMLCVLEGDINGELLLHQPHEELKPIAFAIYDHPIEIEHHALCHIERISGITGRGNRYRI